MPGHIFRQGIELMMNHRLTINSGKRGFTLVEMLVVASLIAIFAGLAVFSITAELERNKQKAAIAEARNIATALSFAYDDLGYFPKIGLLQFNQYNVLDFLIGTGFDAIEYHGYSVGNLENKVKSSWKSTYMAGPGADKRAKFHYTSGRALEIDWPADPWGNPYVAYFVKTIPSPSVGTPPRQAFIQGPGERANFCAGVVSYGRNAVPGMQQPLKLGTDAIANGRRYDGANPATLYKPATPPQPKHYDALVPADYADGSPRAVRMIQMLMPTTDGADSPNIRDPSSDDRLYEF
jgi:prepilin-type N-terminal cleavage/methylation domain-containing protein